MTQELMELLVQMHKLQDRIPVKQCIFEVWEGDALVALVCGFGVGTAYHDYSMATLKRDRRGIGYIATKAVGHLLQKCGYDIWYWGRRVGYFEEFDNCGGRYFNRDEFAA